MSYTSDSTSQSQGMMFNGVDFQSGGYLTPSITAEEILEFAYDEYESTPIARQKSLADLSQKIGQPCLGFDVALDEPAVARWGVIFAQSETDEIKTAVEPLIRHRADQLGFEPPVFEYMPEMTYAQFLDKNDVAPAMGEVEKIPYYLLLVGNPEKIPFRFQYELGSEYAVGRVDFEDVKGYRTYIEQLVDYENASSAPSGKEAIFWATAHKGDRPTELSSSLLADTLYNTLDPKLGFDKQIHSADNATKANLQEALSRSIAPGLIFTASHGLGFRSPDPQQPTLQGALVTQEWLLDTPILPSQILSGYDLARDANVRGSIHFAFACFGAGTPKQDNFAHGKSSVAPIIANYPFVANLPRQELLKGALAFIGHIDRAWGYSFIGPTGNPMLTGFQRALKRLLRGLPVGHALRDQHDHAVQLSHSLMENLTDLDFGKKIAPGVIADLWKERNDARAYAVIGDPAARLRVKDMQ
jgi:hypothetical protein